MIYSLCKRKLSLCSTQSDISLQLDAHFQQRLLGANLYLSHSLTRCTRGDPTLTVLELGLVVTYFGTET